MPSLTKITSNQPQIRLLVIPGLHGSGPDHWQTWLQAQQPDAVRIGVEDWGHADLDRWAGAIDDTLRRHRADAWIAVAHSFGCLALVHHAAHGGRGVQGALLAAPAAPEHFGLDEGALSHALPFASTLVVSASDPWMSHADALYFGRRWGSEVIELGEAGHINPAAGYGPWPDALAWTRTHAQRVAATLHPRARAATPALGFAV
ncbi:MAG TPA: alpha/beta hydrolase [Ideonella sp.]|uniref:RBBP9/YdeN family alpha/beta hydrolase n=1 Tax=Ideonella sp. TaxID=1929293 RepID=UPI002E31ABAD|nr:alpha/beta hydrolase [Ideonella sp.]HEX5682575.1 alpha/beta hydrolase [Ideonella sp.]